MKTYKLLLLIPIIGLIIHIVEPSNENQIGSWFIYQFASIVLLILFIISL